MTFPLPRRQFVQATATGAAMLGTMLSSPGTSMVHGEEPGDNEIRLALVGCGGRGTGAANDALHVENAKTKLVAMADVRTSRLQSSIGALSNQFTDNPEKVDVPEDHQFIGFDAYKNAMDALRPGDIVILTTPLAFRALHFAYAIERGLHVFMEKPLTADGPTSLKMIELANQADDKNLKCGVGLMIRHCRARRALHQQVQDGEIGDILMMRAYRMHGPVASAHSLPKPEGRSEVLWQIERFHSFLWASGGLFSDFYIHQIDETSWMKNAWPIKAQATGGRQYRGDYIDQNFDHYSVEYTYDDGAKLFFSGRTMVGCQNEMASFAHGTKGSAIISKSGHTPGNVAIFDDQLFRRRTERWKFQPPEPNPYRMEWVDLVDAIINNQPYSEVHRGVEASLVTSMGRMAAHTGQEITLEQMRNCPHQFAPDVASLSVDGPAPVMPDADGKYPVPQPGILRDVEYAT